MVHSPVSNRGAQYQNQYVSQIASWNQYVTIFVVSPLGSVEIINKNIIVLPVFMNIFQSSQQIGWKEIKVQHLNLFFSILPKIVCEMTESPTSMWAGSLTGWQYCAPLLLWTFYHLIIFLFTVKSMGKLFRNPAYNNLRWVIIFWSILLVWWLNNENFLRCYVCLQTHRWR